MKKRILAWVVTLCMLVTCVPFTTMAADEIISGTFNDEQATPNIFTWSLNLTTGALAIEGKGDMNITTENPWLPANSSKNLIPWAYYGAEQTDYRSAVKSVSIGSGITTLGRELFYGCTSLEEVTIPGNVVRTAWGTFAQCTALRKVTIEEGFKDLADKAFLGCAALEELNLPNSLVMFRQNVVYGCTSLTTLSLPAEVTLHQNSFGDNKGGENGAAVIPAPETNIGYNIAFTVYEDSDADEYIDTYYPGRIVEYVNGEVVASGDIDGGAEEDTGITWTIYETNKIVFTRDKGEDGKYIGSGKIPDYAAGRYDEAEPDKAVPPWSKDYRTTIKTAVFDAGIVYIGNRTLEEHSALTKVVMANTVTKIGSYVMNASGKVASVKLSEGLAKLSAGTFNNNNTIKELTIPFNTAVDAYSFRQVSENLVLTVCEGSAAHAWAASGETEGVTPIVEKRTYGLKYNVVPVGGNVDVEGGTITWTLKDGILDIQGSGKMKNLNIEATDQPWFYLRNGITEARIGQGITYVGDRYFQECKNLTKVVMADTVTGLGSYLFNACMNLTDVKLSKNITGGGDFILYQVPKLPELTIPANMPVSAKTFMRSGPDTVITIYAGGAAHIAHPDLTITGVQNYDKTTGNTRTLTLGYETDEGTDGTTTWAWDYATKTITIGGSGATTSWHTDATKMGTDGWHMNRGYFQYANIAEKVVIGKDITVIGDYAFMQFTKVRELELEDDSVLKMIGSYAFSNTRLVEVTLPESVEKVMNCAVRASSETDTDTHTLVKFVVPSNDTVLYDTALSRQSKVVVYCNSGSKAADFAIQGNYEYRLFDVEYIIADYRKATKTAMILNSTDASKEANVIFANREGDAITDITVVPVTLEEGRNEIPAGDEFAPTTGNVVIYLWSSEGNIAPLAKPYMKNTVWMLGDSIMADWPDGRYPQEGWGEAFKDVVTENMVVKNRAISGYTAETCYKKIWSTNTARSDWNPVRDEVAAGDYVIISYLHNDYCAVADPGKNNGLYQNTEYINEYRRYVETIADECAEKGAQLILVVPPNRGSKVNFHNQPVEGVDVGDYSVVFSEIAKERNLPYVSIHAWTLEEANKDTAFLDTIYLTKNYVYDLIAKGEFTEEALANHSNKGLAKNHNDHTHLSILGCKNVAEYVASQLKTMNTGIEKFLK